MPIGPFVEVVVVLCGDQLKGRVDLHRQALASNHGLPPGLGLSGMYYTL